MLYLDEFSSPFDNTRKISNCEEFFAMDKKGNVYKVREEFIEDKRYATGKRLTRVDAETGNSLLDTELMCLPENFTSIETWLMQHVVALTREVSEMKDKIEFIENEMESKERESYWS